MTDYIQTDKETSDMIRELNELYDGEVDENLHRSMKIRFDALWEKISSRIEPEEVIASDGATPNYIIRIPKGALRIRAGEYGTDYHYGDKGNDRFVDVVCMSRHFVRKPIYNITTASGKFVSTTADHTCMVIDNESEQLNDTFMMTRKSAAELNIGDSLCSCVPEVWFGEEHCDTADRITDIVVKDNTEGEWVYDLEVDNDRHVYFANGILVHNSQFINLSPVTRCKCIEDGVDPDTRFSELPDATRDKVVKEAYHILDLANANVEKLVNKECHTLHGNILHYSLEYVAAEGMYFKKKHYIVRKIISDDIPCNKFKYSGISVKKAEIPPKMKDFLKDIFESTMTKNWTEADYRKEVEKAYNTFITLDWEDIAYYKKYRTLKRIVSLTESEKGAGVHARAANFYNQLLEKLGLAGRYPKIGVGDEFRYSYVLPTNQYGMNCIAFKTVFPDEFRSLFKPDYETMFEKIFTKSLEHYVEIMGYKTADPTRQEEDPSFSLF